MVLMEDSGEKPTLILDRDPEGLAEIVESSSILEAPHVREVSDAKGSLDVISWFALVGKF